MKNYSPKRTSALCALTSCVNFIRRARRAHRRAVKPSPGRPVDKYLRHQAVVNNVAASELDN